MALVNTGNDPWILEYEACEKLSREIFEQLSQRDSEEINSRTYDSLGGRIRIRLKQFSTEVDQLSDKLNLGRVLSSITAEEKERRVRQIEYLQSKLVQLNAQFNRRSSSAERQERQDRQPFRQDRQVFADLGTTSWGEVNAEPEETRNQGMGDLRQEQQHMLRAQDEGLEALSKVISRQKQIATSINTEVDEQNDILVDIADNVDRMDSRIRNETDMVRIIGRKDKTWGYWLVIILLFITILAVAFA